MLTEGQLYGRSRLHGVRIFLSGSVPTLDRADEYDRIPGAPLHIEEAVICIARAIFIEGGTLVFGGHPSISPLVARVIQDYNIPSPAEATNVEIKEQQGMVWKNPRIEIHQSKVYEQFLVKDTEYLLRQPLVDVRWSEAVEGEFVDPMIKGKPRTEKSLLAMRRAMMSPSPPAAMIAVGGMKGVVDEVDLFREFAPKRPVYLLGTTGGATGMLAKRMVDERNVRLPDSDALDLVKRFWAEQRKKDVEGEYSKEREYYVPYGFIAQRMVEEIIAQLNERRSQ